MTFETVVTAATVTWQVWNRASVPASTQLRSFEKYFTTKTGHGHGFGPCRMKLLGEKYLGGRVNFVSAPASGTTFSFASPRK